MKALRIALAAQLVEEADERRRVAQGACYVRRADLDRIARNMRAYRARLRARKETT